MPGLDFSMAPGDMDGDADAFMQPASLNMASVSDPSLALPAALRGLLGEQSPGVQVTPPEGGVGVQAAGDMGGSFIGAVNPTDGFQRMADGGLVQPAPQMGQLPQGAPQGVGLQQGEQPQISEQDVQQFMQQHPEQVQQMAAEIKNVLADGTISEQQLRMAEQLATVAMQNPNMYPQLRQYAVQQGLIDDAEAPQEFDPAFMFVVVLALRSALADAPAPEQAPINMADGGPILPHMATDGGGPVRGPGTTRSDSVPIAASVDEYVIPAHVVRMKGQEFFDSLLEKYKEHAGDRVPIGGADS